MDKKTAITKYAEIVSRLQSQNVATLRKSAQGKIKNVKGMRKEELVHALADWEAKQDGIDVRALDEMPLPTATQEVLDKNAKKSVNAIAADAPKGGTSVNAIAAETADDAKGATEKAPKRRTAKPQSKTQAKPAPAVSDHESAPKTTAKKTGRKMCAECGQRPVDRKTQGKDSTMCGPCYTYAGWENTHTDEEHADVSALREKAQKARGEAKRQLAERLNNILAQIDECPVCQGQDPAKQPVERRKSKVGEAKIKGNKPDAFAVAAKELGYHVKTVALGNGKVQVIATSREDTISLVWDNNRYNYNESAYTDAKGNTRKVRNASAAKKIMAG